MKHLFALLVATAPALLPATATAQTTPADSAATAVTQPGNPFTVYGFVDAYYGYDFKHARGHERPNFIFSHNRQNEFTVNQGLIGLRYDNDQVRGEVGLHAGTYPSANYAPEDPIIRNIYQAYPAFGLSAKPGLMPVSSARISASSRRSARTTGR